MMTKEKKQRQHVKEQKIQMTLEHSEEKILGITHFNKY